jgi:hypothetical protein
VRTFYFHIRYILLNIRYILLNICAITATNEASSASIVIIFLKFNDNIERLSLCDAVFSNCSLGISSPPIIRARACILGQLFMITALIFIASKDLEERDQCGYDRVRPLCKRLL